MDKERMEKARKKRIKRYLTWAALAAVVALLTAMPLLARQEAEADGPVASILSAEVKTGNLSTALRGGGTLEDDAQEVNLPTGVKITGFLVKNGDSVTEGTPVATVDKVSVMNVITQVNDTMDYLRQELENAREEKVPGTIYATAGGRVKKVFAKAGESVQDVMLRDGCLAVLSLDGLMAVKIENDIPLTTGESVKLWFHDQTEAIGRVKSNLDGVKVITVEDEGYGIGEEVLVSTLEGEAVGSGNLYIHNAWKATAYSGTVATVSAKEEKTVSSGAALFTLEDRDYEGELQRRAAQHRKYEALLQRLLKMYQTGTIDAPCDGVIAGVDDDSPHLLAAEGEEAVVTQLWNSGGGDVRLMLLSSVANGLCDRSAQCKAPTHEADCLSLCTNALGCTAQAHQETCIERCTTAEGCPAQRHKQECVTLCTKADAPEKCSAINHYDVCIHSCTHGDEDTACKGKPIADGGHHYTTCVESCISSDGAKDCPATRTHRTSCIKRCCKADAEGICDSSIHYTDCIAKCSGSDSCAASKHTALCPYYGMTYKAYVAKVDAVGTSELVVYWDASGTHYDVVKTGSGWGFAGGSFDPSLLVKQGTLAVANAAAFRPGDIVLAVTGYRGSTETDLGVHRYSSGSAAPSIPGMGDLSGLLGGFHFSAMMGGMSGYGNYAGAQVPQEDLYDLDGATLLTVIPQETMTLEITLDEQDIARVSPGMEAQVTVEALRGQTFPATVTRVGIHGSNSGGSSKFTVELTLKMGQNMLSGMSAGASIPMEKRLNVLTLPAEAIFEQGARSMVYTALDKKTGEPIQPVAVKTGLSDGETVEILEGLQAGDTVYYMYYDVLELDTSAEAEKYSFG